MTHLEPFDLVMIWLGLLMAAGYAFAVWVYWKKPAYRSAIVKGVLLWAALWLLLAILWTADFLCGNSEVFEGLWWVGLPLTREVDSEIFRRLLGYKTRYFIALFLFFVNWCWVFATLAIGVKAIRRRIVRR